MPNDLMTTSLDPVILMQQTAASTGSGNSATVVPGSLPQESWATSGPHRPNTLFEYDANNGSTITPPNQQHGREQLPQHSTDAASTTSEVVINKHIKDIYLQDLSDSK